MRPEAKKLKNKVDPRKNIENALHSYETNLFTIEIEKSKDVWFFCS